MHEALKWRSRVVVTSVIALLLVGTAYARQMRAEDPPTVEGPVTEANDRYTSRPCDTQKIKVRGRVAATGRICWTFFEVEPVAETDSDNDYGIWWIQATFTPADRWCVDEVEAHLDMGQGFPLTAMTVKDKKVRSVSDLRMRLDADADGNSSVPIRIHNKLTAYPGRYLTTWSGTTFKARWKGSPTRKKVALAGGIEGSWDSDTGGPYIFASGGTASVLKPCR